MLMTHHVLDILRATMCIKGYMYSDQNESMVFHECTETYKQIRLTSETRKALDTITKPNSKSCCGFKKKTKNKRFIKH